jgi:hypothetical protein
LAFFPFFSVNQLLILDFKVSYGRISLRQTHNQLKIQNLIIFGHLAALLVLVLVAILANNPHGCHWFLFKFFLANQLLILEFKHLIGMDT